LSKKWIKQHLKKKKTQKSTSQERQKILQNAKKMQFAASHRVGPI
jgi:hypothetical protein